MTTLDKGNAIGMADIDRMKSFRGKEPLPKYGYELRNKVFAIEAEMKKLPQLELKVNHHFGDGLYARELIIPKDTILVGKIHKYQNMNMLIKGELDVLIDGEINRVTAPFITISPPGTKRIAYAIEDSVWVTIHGTNEIDLAKIEDHFIAQSEQEWLEFCKSEPSLPFNEPQLPLEGDQKCLSI